MARFAFCGPSYTSQSPISDAQRTSNWYVEQIESGQGKSSYALYPTPGLSIFCTLPFTCRKNGLIAINGRVFAAAGTNLYEIFSNGTFVSRGLITNDNGVVSMAASQPIIGSGTPQLAIISAGTLYVLNLATNQLTIPTGPAGTALQIVYVDGFYVLLNTNGVFQFSAPEDATTWPGIETEATTSYPDATVGIASVHRELFTLSSLKGTTYYNAGDQPIPFDEITGGDFEQGTVAPFSLVPLDNTLFFIGANKEGAGVAWRLSGYTPTRISNHAIEFAWQGYPTISDAVCYGYQDQGHTFYVCFFPTANRTWVYDVATQMWHEREFWNASTGQKSAHRSCSHAYAFGQHLVGDWASGNVYSMSITQTMDFGNVIKRVRRAPHISNENEWMFFQQLQIDLEVGLSPSQLLPGTTTPTVFNFKDSAGKYWNMGISNVGVLTTTPSTAFEAGTLFMNDTTGATSWQITVSPITGVLNLVSVPFNAGYSTSLVMYSSTGQSEWRINVRNLGSGLAQFQTSLIGTVYRNPTMQMRFSDDGAQTWSNWHNADTGGPGSYKARTIWRRLGRSRDRVFEVQVSDPIPWRITEAYLKATNGYTPTERITDRVRKMA